MKAYLVPTLVGVFAVGENRKVLGFRPFPKDPREAAERFKRSQIEVLEEERQLKESLGRKKFREFVFCYRKPGAKNIEPENPGEQFVKKNLRKLAVDNGFSKDEAEIIRFLSSAMIELAKVQIKKAVQRDSLVVQANAAIEELDRSINVYIERLREWYGLYFPEMDRNVTNHEKFAALVAKFGSRDAIEEPSVEAYKNSSMGADFLPVDIEMMRDFSAKILEMYKLRDKITKYSESVLKEVAPNLLDLAGVSLASKLIAKAGGLDKLSRMPSSTIQLIGAEKALFRFLKGKGKSPRHGVIFSHPLVQNAKDDVRGKLARVVASKLSIAAKMDYYSKVYKGEALRKEMQDKAKEILSRK